MNEFSRGEQPRILIAAGGTGGHIFPAIALGEAFHLHFPQVLVRFACGERELERRLYADAGIEPIVFPARQLGSGISGKLAGASAAAANTLRAIRLIRAERFNAVVGMGGYVSGPAVLGGILSGRKTIVHEANSIPGKTNRLLAPYVSLTALHFEATARQLRARRSAVVGMPIRETTGTGDRTEAMRLFGLNPAKKTLLVLGGSQGARFLYQTLMNALPALDVPANSNVQVLWSTGADNFDELDLRLRDDPPTHLVVKLVPFISRMDLAIAAADVALARAGASSMAELLSSGIYTLYVPFPSAIYDHQTLNAQQAVSAGVGEMIPEKELTPDRAAEVLQHLFEKAIPGHRVSVPETMNSRRAAQNLAEAILALIR
ncbi:MAG: UDP-N-acetylglucosamine--N-acetylmuramyl-(pentapeptide) pyrophosphoryl-undecaprenol N-acetylglucosamine transferase [Candidatus Sumerlaeaceae bacterium]